MSTPATSPMTRRVRAYFAPVDRTSATPTIFDAAQNGGFDLEDPPSPWLDLGWCRNFKRQCDTKITALEAGTPAIAQSQMRTEVGATVSVEFESWGKLQLALTSGSQQMNLLTTAIGATANGSGGAAVAATPLLSGSTATQLNVGLAAAIDFTIGGIVAVDVDYTGQTGFVGSGAGAAYVRSASAVNNDTNYIRRVTWNVGRVIASNDGVLQLAEPLPAGAPTSSMKASPLAGFVDREGGSFFAEWSALFVLDGEQGDRVLFHYPRLQPMQGSAEAMETTAAPLEQVRLAGAFRALPVTDTNDDERVLCFRSYLPAAMREIL